jgi:ADP-ribosylglycohydrolase
VIGSVHEYTRRKSAEFPLFDPRCRFTDDTVLTVATAYAILTDTPYGTAYLGYGRRYPDADYGGSFRGWLGSPEPQPFNSWGNGSAMRVAPVGFAFDTIDDVLREAQRSAEVTHDHAEGIKGAQATALAVFLGRSGASKEEIRTELARRFGYELRTTVDAIRLAISLGGDADTQAAIAGGIAHAFYRHVPDTIVEQVRARLPVEFLDVIDRFQEKYPLRSR